MTRCSKQENYGYAIADPRVGMILYVSFFFSFLFAKKKKMKNDFKGRLPERKRPFIRIKKNR